MRVARQLTIAVALVLAVSQVGAPTAIAAYNKDCSVGALGHTWTTISRTKSNPGIDAVIGELHVRTLRPCINPNSSNYDMPFALAANLESGTNIVQIGYAVCGHPTQYCNGNIPNDGNPHFVYTNIDHNGGLVVLADGWYKAPVAGHAYRFRIAPATNASGQSVWEYCIRDKNTGEAYDCTKTSDLRNFTQASLAWWGTETYNTASQNGNAQNESAMNFRWLQYRRSNTWWVVSDQVGCEKKSVTEFGFPKAYPSHYQCNIASTVDVDGDGQVNDSETLQSYTLNY